MNRKHRHIKKLNDLDVIQLYQETKDRQCVGVLFERYAHLIFGVCLKYLKNKEDGEDALHSIFEKLFDLLLKNNISRFDSWIYSVSKNHCLMILRKKSKLQFQDLNEEIFIDKGITEEDGFKDEKKIKRLEFFMGKIKEEQGYCIQLFYMQSKSYKEISVITGYEIKQVKSHIQNGKRMLQTLFKKEE